MDENSNKPLWIIVAVLVALAMISNQCSEDDPAPASSAAPIAAAPAPAPAPAPSIRPPGADARLEECRAKLKAAIPLDLITNMSFDEGRPKLWVGPTWHKVPIDIKEALAREAACFFLAGDETKAIRFPIYDGMTGKEIATWKFTKLDVE